MNNQPATTPNKSVHDECMMIIAPTLARAHRWAAALEAKGIPVVVERIQRRSVLRIPFLLKNQARAELATYEAVNWGWPQSANGASAGAADARGTKRLRRHRENWPVIAAATAMLVFHCILVVTGNHELFIEIGGADNRAITMDGDWFRAFTAMTLHGDFTHVLANLLWASVFGMFLAQIYGYGTALLGATLAGAAANFANAILAGAPRISIGASTAVMALLGMLAVNAIAHKLGNNEDGAYAGRGKNALRAAVAALAVLSLLGTAPGTDVTGHLFGFLAGVFAGIAIIPLRSSQNEKLQLLCMSVAITLQALAWRLALVASQ